MPFKWNPQQLKTHIENIEGTEMMNVVTEFKKFREVIIYMPTWRDGNPNFMEEAIPDFELLNNKCKGRNILFAFKVHVNTVFNKDLDAYSNLVLLNSSLDMYPLLPYTTTLLTDYSSIFFDYALLNKKIIFYPFDLEKYKATNRELYFDYAEITREEIIADSFKDLLHILDAGENGPNRHSFQKYLNDEFDYAKEINFIRKRTGLKQSDES
jgi:CDP-glycerol glycerophosphotransferase (TagB/SpsB family)